MMGVGIILNSIYFYFLISVFGDNQGEASRWHAFFIVLAGGIVQAICLLKFPDQIGLLGTALLSTGVMVLLLVIWLRTSLVSAIKIVGCFLAGLVVLQLGIDALSRQAMT